MSVTTSKWSKWLLQSIGALAVATLAACGGSDNDSGGSSGNNVSGLISGSDLQTWMDDWANNKPDGVTGNLVILQTSEGAAGSEYIAPDGTDVFTYAVDSSEWVETRSNGVVETISMVPSGSTMDAFLTKYGIDPNADMIVCAQGSPGAGAAMRAGRCWYNFSYWGTAADHLAVLDGGNEWNATNNGLSVSTTGSTPPNNGTASVKDLADSNFELQATLGDVMDATADSNVLIVDARSADEYNGLERKTKGATGTSCGDADGDDVADSDYNCDGSITEDDMQCYTAMEGHPANAVHLEYSDLLTDNYTYKDAATLESLFDAAGYQDGQTIITYCKTTFRAMVNGIAANLVLGYPIRFYDGAMVEWLQMDDYNNQEGSLNLSAGSPWLTDGYTEPTPVTNNNSAVVEALTVVDENAADTNAIIDADTAYKAN